MQSYCSLNFEISEKYLAAQTTSTFLARRTESIKESLCCHDGVGVAVAVAVGVGVISLSVIELLLHLWPQLRI